MSRRQDDLDLTDATPFDSISDIIPADVIPDSIDEIPAADEDLVDDSVAPEIGDDDETSLPTEDDVLPEEDESLPEEDDSLSADDLTEEEDDNLKKRQADTDLIDDEDTDFASPDADQETAFAPEVSNLLSDVVDSIDDFLPTDDLKDDLPVDEPEVPTEISDVAPEVAPEDITPEEVAPEDLSVEDVPSTTEEIEPEVPSEDDVTSDLLKRDEDDEDSSFNVEVDPSSSDLDAEETGDNDESDLGEDDEGLLGDLLDDVTGEEDSDDF